MLSASVVGLSGEMSHGVTKQHRLVVMLRLLSTKILKLFMVLSASVLELLVMLLLWLVQMLLLLGGLARI